MGIFRELFPFCLLFIGIFHPFNSENITWRKNRSSGHRLNKISLSVDILLSKLNI